MYKVVLVDDEIWSLEGIRKLFDWEGIGFKIAAQTTDSSEAYEIICDLKPDVVFTDIRMPEISGIELLKMCRENGIKSEFIIISGYAEFEYAQEALRGGAFDYILKPIGYEKGMAFLNKLKLHLEEKRISLDIDIFEKLVYSQEEPQEILKKAGFPADEEYWEAVVFYGQNYLDSHIMAAIFEGISHHILRIGKDKVITILNGGQALEKDVMAILDAWEPGKGLNIGVSAVSKDIRDLSRLIKEADLAAYNGFIQDKTGVVKFNANYNAEIESMVKKLERLITEKNVDEIINIIDGIPNLFIKEGLGMYQVTNLWNHIAVILRDKLEGDAVVGKTDYLSYMELTNRFGSLAVLCDYIKALLKDVCCPAGSSPKQKNINENFIALLDYVRENYNKKLILSELSEMFFLNMSYCSELFKKVTGFTFMDYVTKLRMEKALELLKTGNYTTNMVCDMTGYNDSYYFCKTFKKFHGVSLSQYSGKRP